MTNYVTILSLTYDIFWIKCVVISTSFRFARFSMVMVVVMCMC